MKVYKRIRSSSKSKLGDHLALREAFEPTKHHVSLNRNCLSVEVRDGKFVVFQCSLWKDETIKTELAEFELEQEAEAFVRGIEKGAS